MAENEVLQNLSSDEIEEIRSAVSKEVTQHPPTIGLVGVSGVGKSYTINTLFKTNRPISHTVACTKEFEVVDMDLSFTGSKRKGIQVPFRVIDAPGLGEDITQDPHYMEMYRKHLPQCDVILWILAAKNRGIALDQMYLQELREFHDKMVFGVNQVDLIEPMNWNKNINLPSEEQENNIDIIVQDRREKLQRVIQGKIKIVPYSAKTRYRLQTLFTTIIESCPSDRAWIFNSLKNFRYDDFIPTTWLHKLILWLKELIKL